MRKTQKDIDESIADILAALGASSQDVRDLMETIEEVHG